MLDADHAGMDILADFGFEFNAPPWRLNYYRVPVGDAERRRCLDVDLGKRFRAAPPQWGDIAIARMAKGGDPSPSR